MQEKRLGLIFLKLLLVNLVIVAAVAGGVVYFIEVNDAMKLFLAGVPPVALALSLVQMHGISQQTE